MCVETIGAATLILGDALEVMEGLSAIDAVITDPPYCSGSVSEASRTAAKGQGLRSENIAKLGWFVGDNMGTAGLSSLLRSMAFRALKILAPDGSMLVFCDWRMVPNLAPVIESAGLRYQNMVVWDKGMMGLGMGFRAQHEIILHYTAGAPKYHDLGTSNVLKSARVGANDREHQTQKPVDLMQRLASSASQMALCWTHLWVRAAPESLLCRSADPSSALSAILSTSTPPAAASRMRKGRAPSSEPQREPPAAHLSRRGDCTAAGSVRAASVPLS